MDWVCCGAPQEVVKAGSLAPGRSSVTTPTAPRPLSGPWRALLVSASHAPLDATSSAWPAWQDACSRVPLRPLTPPLLRGGGAPSIRGCHPGAGPPSPIPCLPRPSSAPHPQCSWGTWVGCVSHLRGLQGMRERGVWERSQTHLFIHSFCTF